MKKLWGGAFQESNDELVIRFCQSIEQDLRFWQEELICSVAHARMLGKVGLISTAESQSLVDGLEKIHEEGPNSLPRDAEDIHTAIEIRLKALIGSDAEKLGIARSRNDQVAACTRLYVHNELLVILDSVKKFQSSLLEMGKKYRKNPMPGFTHMQPAQPITLGYYLLAHFWAMQRNGWRAERLFEAANYSPMGSGALAGTSFAIDRDSVSRELGFFAPIPNALDAVSDRSFVLDALHVSAIIMLSLSRLCTDLVLFSTPAFGFVRLGDRVTTGSILLPQKRNPDVAELIRGRSAHTVGNWTAFASMMKGLPLGYNRDAQDDKPLLYESFDLVKDSLQLASILLDEAEWNLRAMAKAANSGSSTALDLAEELTQSGMSFRDAHQQVGEQIVDGTIVLPSAAESIRKRVSDGSPGPKPMAAQIRQAGNSLKKVGFPKPY
jgi:argininosuccinate lyase